MKDSGHKDDQCVEMDSMEDLKSVRPETISLSAAETGDNKVRVILPLKLK